MRRAVVQRAVVRRAVVQGAVAQGAVVRLLHRPPMAICECQ